MDHPSPRRLLDRVFVPGAVGLGVVAALAYAAGIEATAGTLAAANARALAAAVVAELVVLGLWGVGLGAAMATMGCPVSPSRAIAAFAATTFVTNATPFGRAGGNPVSGLVVAWAGETTYETGLAAIVGVHTIYNLVSLGVGLVAVGHVLTTTRTRGLARGAGDAVGATLVLLVAVVVLWRRRRPAAAVAVGVLARATAAVGRVVGGSAVPTDDSLRERVDRFVDHLERFAGSERALVAVVGLGATGQSFVGAALWLSLAAVGESVSYPLLLALVPLAWTAAVGPTPGGLGGIEAILVGALVATTAVEPPAAVAGVVVYRLVTFWLPTAVGGAIAAAFGVGR